MFHSEIIDVEKICTSHNVEMSFLEALAQSGLLHIVKVDNAAFISDDQLPCLEKMIRFYYDMDINLEGIEAIQHLLRQIQEMQQEIMIIKNRLALYEQF